MAKWIMEGYFNQYTDSCNKLFICADQSWSSTWWHLKSTKTQNILSHLWGVCSWLDHLRWKTHFKSKPYLLLAYLKRCRRRKILLSSLLPSTLPGSDSWQFLVFWQRLLNIWDIQPYILSSYWINALLSLINWTQEPLFDYLPIT